MAEQNLNAQQIAAVNERFTQHVAKVIDQLNLRKWSIETALAATGSSTLLKVTPGPDGAPGRIEICLMTLANEIYNFVVKPALEPINPD